MPRTSDKPIVDRVFEAWESARKSKATFEKKASALNKLSSQLDDAGVKAVEAKKEAFLKAEKQPVAAGKIEI